MKGPQAKRDARQVTIIIWLVLLLAIIGLVLQGDPCDTAPNPDQCKSELNER